MYCFTVGFVSADSPPQLLLGPEVSVAEQEESLQEKARVDDGGEFLAIEIVYSNGRPTRRVDFTPASVKEAAAAAAAEKAAADAAAMRSAKAARRAELIAELEILSASDPADGTGDEGLQWAASLHEKLPPVAPEAYAPEAAALDADDEAAATDDQTVAAPADDEAAATDDQTVADPAPVSGKRKRA